MRLAFCVPTSGTCPSTFAYALAHSVAFFATWEGTEDVTLLMQESSVVHSNREQLARRALEWGATHICWCDHDMYWPPKAVVSLISRDQPIVACNYPKRKYPIEWTAVTLEGERLPTRPESTGLQEVQYCGMGLCLVKAEVYEKLEAPWFLPGYMRDQQEYTTEDAPFMVRCKMELDIPTLIDHDASKMDLAHIGLHTFQWNQHAEVVHA